MSALVVRRVVVAVCALGVAGMIAASIADSTGAALTFGLVTTAGVLCLVVATAVAKEPAGVDEAQAARVEGLVTELVAAGADEGRVRSLVREAARLGRAGR